MIGGVGAEVMQALADDVDLVQECRELEVGHPSLVSGRQREYERYL